MRTPFLGVRTPFVGAAMAAALLGCASAPVAAQTYPSRPITLVVFLPAGGSATVFPG